MWRSLYGRGSACIQYKDTLNGSEWERYTIIRRETHELFNNTRVSFASYISPIHCRLKCPCTEYTHYPFHKLISTYFQRKFDLRMLIKTVKTGLLAQGEGLIAWRNQIYTTSMADSGLADENATGCDVMCDVSTNPLL